jgi:hypothetical protein
LKHGNSGSEKSDISYLAGLKMGIGKTLGSYVWWTHDRGNLHYDIMVTVILLFIFVTPIYVNFNDKPAERTPHPTGVVVQPDGTSGFIYRVDGSAVKGTSDAEIMSSLTSVIEPIAGEMKISRYETITDLSGHTVAYKVWVRR